MFSTVIWYTELWLFINILIYVAISIYGTLNYVVRVYLFARRALYELDLELHETESYDSKTLAEYNETRDNLLFYLRDYKLSVFNLIKFIVLSPVFYYDLYKGMYDIPGEVEHGGLFTHDNEGLKKTLAWGKYLLNSTVYASESKDEYYEGARIDAILKLFSLIFWFTIPLYLASRQYAVVLASDKDLVAKLIVTREKV